MKIGFVCGAFDLFHVGHILMLKEAKKHCDMLVAGLQTNPRLDRPKKNKPVQSLWERNMQLKACRYIDRLFVYETEKDLEDILSFVNIDIRFIGGDWKQEDITGKEICEKRGIEIIYLPRDHRFSTSELRKRVAKAEKVKNG